MASGDRSKPYLRLKLALQGGGSHGAFTWGVLDRLLEEPRLRIDAVSGASAGALNAAFLAQGWAEGGRAGAKRLLAAFWTRVGRIAAPGPGDLPGFAAPWMASLTAEALMRAVWRFPLNPVFGNPLRALIAPLFDAEALRRPRAPRVVIAATSVGNGAPHCFGNEAVSLDVLLASAALPQIFGAVQIGAESYWDGGYASNPPILSLIAEPGGNDVLIVQISPMDRPGPPPRDRAAIAERVAEFAFAHPLRAELQALALAQRVIARRARDPAARRLKAARTHLIAAPEALLGAGAASRLRTSIAYLEALRHMGRAAGESWLSGHGRACVGRTSSVDPGAFAAPAFTHRMAA
jgi:NTE family protein